MDRTVKTLWLTALIAFVYFSPLEAEDKDVLVIGHTMYQKQKIDYKTVVTFAADKEGKRVWNWDHAQRYCKNLRLNNYSDWQVASRAELLKIMTKDQGYNRLYVKNSFARYMPEPDPKYFDVWMWTRNSKASNLGAFVNFKKGKTGWADRKYKGYVICTRKVKTLVSQKKRVTCKGNARQEVTYSKEWVASWRTCSGDGAIKKDGTLWQFGEIGGCDWGQIYPVDPYTGKPAYTMRYIYHLEPKKIGNGFYGAKIINGGYRVYAIKKDGTLWGWGEGFRNEPMLLSKSREWVDFGVKFEGNGCCAHDIGLKRDGSLWIFPESFDYSQKSPIAHLKRVGKQKGWDKVILRCCSMYAMKKDGSLWVNRDRLKGLEFVKFDPKIDCKIEGESFCRKLKSAFSKMPSQTIYNYYDDYNEMKSQKVNVGSRAGTLCLKPEIKYTF